MRKKKVVKKSKRFRKPVRKSGKKLSRKSNSFSNFGKELEHEIKDVEKWVYERRKFLIKLAWVVGFVTVLLIISNIYLKVKGVGI